MTCNAVGRDIPDKIGTYACRPYTDIFGAAPEDKPVVSRRSLKLVKPGESKLQASLKDAIRACGLADGMTISFHHCFREGDMIIGQVLTAIRELGINYGG